MTRGSFLSAALRAVQCTLRGVEERKAPERRFFAQVREQRAEKGRVLARGGPAGAHGAHLMKLEVFAQFLTADRKMCVLRARAHPHVLPPFARRASTSCALKIGSCK